MATLAFQICSPFRDLFLIEVFRLFVVFIADSVLSVVSLVVLEVVLNVKYVLFPRFEKLCLSIHFSCASRAHFFARLLDLNDSIMFSLECLIEVLV